MSNMHVLTASGGRYQIALHITIPNGNNSAGISWSQAMLNSGIGGRTVLITGDGTAGTISVAEKALITAGSVFEIVDDNIDPTGGGQATTPAQMAAFLNDYYAARAIEVRASQMVRLAWFGQSV